jgi:hypothetical protein
MKTDWTNPIPTTNPDDENEDVPRSMRWPKGLAADVEKLAKETGQTFSKAALYLIRAALAEVEASRGGKKGNSSPQGLKRAVAR